MKPFTEYVILVEFPDDAPGIAPDRASLLVAKALSKAGVAHFQVESMTRERLARRVEAHEPKREVGPMSMLITLGVEPGTPVRHVLDVHLHPEAVVHADTMAEVSDAIADNPGAWLAYGPGAFYPATVGRLQGPGSGRHRIALTFAHDPDAQDAGVLWQAATVLSVGFVLDLNYPDAVAHLVALLREPIAVI